MASNMKLIETKTVGVGGIASIDFTSIPQTYTDLVLVTSLRCTSSASNGAYITFNGSSSSYSQQYVVGTGAVTAAGTGSAIITRMVPDNATANTFSNSSAYITNYTSSNNKSVSTDTVNENNAQAALMNINAELWSNSAAINQITITPASGGDIAQYSTASLYGVSSAAISPTAYATGGAIYQDDTYFYHVFASSGVFTPTQSLSCDTLVVAGGGGGGRTGGGGGAGGLRGLTSQSMTAQAYTITIGAGGAGNNVDGQQAGDGTTSSIAGSGFSTINTTGGGGASSYGATSGRSGGSGGGGSAGVPNSSAGAGNAGGYSPVEGYAGGTGTTDSQRGGGGGGGGASQAGQSTTTGAVRIGGNGGNGSSAFSSWGFVTGTGENVSGTYWYAGGGGAASDTASLRGLGGNGGGGDAGTNNTNPSNAVPGMPNTGGGGGANSGNYPAGANGGSGLVILRYAK
jgi:hypothetical protein